MMCIFYVLVPRIPPEIAGVLTVMMVCYVTISHVRWLYKQKFWLLLLKPKYPDASIKRDVNQLDSLNELLYV